MRPHDLEGSHESLVPVARAGVTRAIKKEMKMKIIRTTLVALAALFTFTTMVMSQERLAINWNTDKIQLAQVQSSGSTTIIAPSATKTGADTSTKTTVTTVQTSAWASWILDWMYVAFGGTIGTLITALAVRGLGLLGIQVNNENKAQLQALVVNGINAGYAKAKVQASTLSPLELKGRVAELAIDYVQSHGEKIIKATGLDPKDGEVVDAIRARVETALNDPATPTPAEITPKTGQPQVNGVVINGAKVA